MNLLPRHKLLLKIGAAILLVHLVCAATLEASFGLTIFGDALACAFLVLAILAFIENSRHSSGVLSLFWKLMCTGLFFLFLAEAYWVYFDSMRRFSVPSPVTGDSLFLLAHIFFLFALALRPHSSSAGRDLGLRWPDFALLACWWFTLYGYFCLPWQTVIQDFSKYNPGYYLLALILHLVIVGALAMLWQRSIGAWRTFYANMFLAFLLIAGGNLTLSIAIDTGLYHAGGFFDTPFFVGLYWLSYIGALGAPLKPGEDTRANREVKQGVWTARVAMLAIVSLPAVALAGYFAAKTPAAIALFRLKLVFGAMICLGVLLFWKLTLLSRQLVHLVGLTSASITNLKAVQARASHAQKLTALGRLAAGATHEISNPLTAILGYSELLVDIPSLSTEDRERAEAMQQHVRRAQGAVDSLRNSLRTNPAVQSTPAVGPTESR